MNEKVTSSLCDITCCNPQRPTLGLAFLKVDYHFLASLLLSLALQYSLKCLGLMSSFQEWLIIYGSINDLEGLGGKNVLLNACH